MGEPCRAGFGNTIAERFSSWSAPTPATRPPFIIMPQKTSRGDTGPRGAAHEEMSRSAVPLAAIDRHLQGFTQ
jgi:hypothetical protein